MVTQSGNEIRHDFYYGNPDKLDLQVMRERAHKLSTQRDRLGQLTHCIIHHHNFNTPCTASSGYFHEDFPPVVLDEE